MKERRIAAGKQLSYYEAGFQAPTTPGAGPTTGGGGGHAADRRVSRSRTRERDSVLSTTNQRDSSVDGYFSNPAQSPYIQPSLAPSIAGYEDSLRSRSEAGSVAGGEEEHDDDDANSAKHGSGSTVGAGDLQDPFEGSVAGSLLREPIREEERLDEDEDDADLDEDEEEEDVDEDDVELTLKDRQDAINIEHPFGLPIWKPALYKKSRSVTRNAETALHSIPSAAAQRHLLPGNLLWVLLFGWWLSIIFFVLAAVIWIVEGGGGRYSSLVGGLAWYIGWPFGKYVEGEGKLGSDEEEEDEEVEPDATGSLRREASDSAESSAGTIKPTSPYDAAEESDRVTPLRSAHDEPEDSRPPTSSSQFTIRASPPTERDSLLRTGSNGHGRVSLRRGQSYGATNSGGYKLLSSVDAQGSKPTLKRWLGRIAYWPLFFLVIAPLMLSVCVLCWGLVVTIPMAKLVWVLLQHLYTRPLALGFRPAPTIVVPDKSSTPEGEEATSALKRERLRPGQAAPTGGPRSTVLLCTYRAAGTQYFKYTVGGVNIFFINLLPLVFFVIFDAWVLLPLSEHRDLGPLFNLISSRVFIFTLSIASVIPLSYFIGMAVASISAQSSIGMGAVINATFGSIIEILLYSIALMQGKGRLVEGSIVGSLLAGVLVMPGMSMLSGAFRRKEQKFNAKSAGVTSTMLIMAIIGTLTPTLFYQAYGSFELSCTGCPDAPVGFPSREPVGRQPWMCQSCRYSHPDPAKDPFYQDSVKHLMYFCAGVLLFSYLIGLWFSLRTHASQIWQNPQQLLNQPELATTGALHPAHRASIHNRLTPGNIAKEVRDYLPTTNNIPGMGLLSRPSSYFPLPHERQPLPPSGAQPRPEPSRRGSKEPNPQAMTSSIHSTGSGGVVPPAGSLTPFIESYVQRDGGSSTMPTLDLPGSLTSEDFTRAVTAATVTALRHQQTINSAQKPRPSSAPVAQAAQEEEEHGGHDGPSWSRFVSATVLLSCTVLYAIIAEILVDVVDVVLEGSGIDEKFLGITIFALVPNTTEFMNAMSFALNGNIALSMEIGSAYALQVCLLQIPAMVAFSALYDPSKMGEVFDTFTLIFPQYDCIAIIFSIFLLTYTYIEARSNYHRGSILILAYLVLLAGFYFAPDPTPEETSWPLMGSLDFSSLTGGMDALSTIERVRAGFKGLWAY
ncbi:hypothetical protein BDY24DRAFT_426472 [Mrakia frigida]|uniref:calcium/hydrogen antiporter n=1 Tax=Mrakia frigida TaxID=29902 RepID=UPI003FCC0E46